MPSWAAKRNMKRSFGPSGFAHCVIDAEPAAGVMMRVMPFSWRYLSPASTTPVFTLPMTPDRSDIAASSWPIRAPRSFLASSSRSMASIFSFFAPTWMPPAALISAMASFAPSRAEVPIGAEPPVNGPVMAILIEFCASAGVVKAHSAIANSHFMGQLLCDGCRRSDGGMLEILLKDCQQAATALDALCSPSTLPRECSYVSHHHRRQPAQTLLARRARSAVGAVAVVGRRARRGQARRDAAGGQAAGGRRDRR